MLVENGELRFAHHRLQEYFAARMIASTYEENGDPTLLDAYVDDVWSEEIIALVAAASRRPDAILEYLLDRPNLEDARVFVAAACAGAAGSRISPDLKRRLFRVLEAALENRGVAIRVRAVRALARCGPTDPQTVAGLLRKQLSDPSPWVRETSLACLDELGARRAEGSLPAANVLRRLLNRLEAFVAGFRDPEEWQKYAYVLAGFAVFGFVGALGIWLGRQVGLRVFAASPLYMLTSYCFFLCFSDQLRHEIKVLRLVGGFSASVLARALALLLFAGMVLFCQLILLTPLPWLATTALVAICAWLGNKRWFVASSSEETPFVVAGASFGHMVPALAGGAVLSALGVLRDAELDGFAVLGIALSFFGIFTIIVVCGVMDTILLGYHGNSVHRGRSAALKVLRAIAQTEYVSFLRVLVARANLIRRRAIRVLGHLPYSAETMRALIRIVGDVTESVMLRDAAAQAIDEIQTRQRRDGETDGLEVSPGFFRVDTGTRGTRMEYLAVRIIGILALPSFAASLYGLTLSGLEIARQFRTPTALNGFVCGRLGLDGAAVSLFEEHLRRSPDDMSVRNAVAWVYATSRDKATRNPTRAVEYASKVVEADGRKTWTYLDTMAEANLAAEKYEDALAAMQMAVRTNPTSEILKERLLAFEKRVRDASKNDTSRR